MRSSSSGLNRELLRRLRSNITPSNAGNQEVNVKLLNAQQSTETYVDEEAASQNSPS